MKILLLGEYSNLHATLAKGLKALGQEVVVASNGDFWKNYPRDIDLQRAPGKSGGAKLIMKIYSLLPKLKDYDIVQLINPMFVELKAKRILPIYKQLRKQNKKMFLLGAGMDYYWVSVNSTTMPLRYSDFNIGKTLRTNPDALKERADWINTDKEKLNKYIANDCDGIITMLYEYYACYHPLFPDKTTFIPAPIEIEKTGNAVAADKGDAENVGADSETDKYDGILKIFIGISKGRSEYKGTDIMLKAAQRLNQKYPDKTQLRIAEGVPFEEYKTLMEGSDIILDQLYSYTPAMNALLAMSKGIIVAGGGEPENYDILGETALRPIVNVLPTEQSVFEQLEQLVLHPERVPQMKKDSIEYIRKHHDYLQVAQKYLDYWRH